MVMNKLWKTGKSPSLLILRDIYRLRVDLETGHSKIPVKQRGQSGTFLHETPGISLFFGGKTPFPLPCFCE
jgi:hypothetical protein